MVDGPTYRAEPDPEFADRLERVLLQRLTAPAGSRSRRGVAQNDAPARTDTDLGDEAGEIISLAAQDRATGHEPPTPVRRSPGRWLLVAAVAAVTAVMGTLFVAANGNDDNNQVPATSSTSTTAPAQNMLDLADSGDVVPVEPGRYFIDPDGDDTTPLRVSFDVAPEDWMAWFGALNLLTAEDESTGLGIATVANVVRDGCLDLTPLDPPVGPTVDDLATSLSELAPLEVAAPPTDVTLFGYEGKHLELTHPDRSVDCAEEGDPFSRTAPINGRSFPGSALPGHTQEFWILEVEGTRLVLVKFDSPEASPQNLAERDAIFDSIRIEP